MRPASRVLKAENYEWKGVEKKAYKENSSLFRDVRRFTLLGNQIPELNFETRYFEIGPGGYSSLEHHRHPHAVVVIRGSGSVILDNEIFSISAHDVVYIAPETIHQFHADNQQHLGFLCVVDRYRDKPAIPDDAEVESRITSENVLNKIKK
ncbi:MAG: cupin domain-containing protein [Balneolaceae bacterium]|nr:MAG: cupin domain-containing protein [Balneolaceae bacterium]